MFHNGMKSMMSADRRVGVIVTIRGLKTQGDARTHSGWAKTWAIVGDTVPYKFT